MAEIQKCPSCGELVSKRAVECQRCGEIISGVPTAITIELLQSLRDEDLAMLLFRFASTIISQRGCWDGTRTDERRVLAELPVPVRAAYRLICLDSEVYNGGFFQWFTNSSGLHVDEALQDLRLVSAHEHFALVGRAVELNRLLEAKFRLIREMRP
jgi:hypothetical protein